MKQDDPSSSSRRAFVKKLAAGALGVSLFSTAALASDRDFDLDLRVGQQKPAPRDDEPEASVHSCAVSCGGSCSTCGKTCSETCGSSCGGTCSGTCVTCGGDSCNASCQNACPTQRDTCGCPPPPPK